MNNPAPTQLSKEQQSILDFNKTVNGPYFQNQLKQAIGKNAGAFATSLVEVFTNDKQLQSCDPKKVAIEAVRAASLNLGLNKQLGYAYITVFNNWDKVARKSVPTPTFMIAYKGYIQLAMRTGQYKILNADIVFEGMMQGRNRLTGAIDLSGEPTSDKIVGYFAHFELNNGFSKTLYMTIEEMAKYALRYSPSFKRNAEKNPIPSPDQLCDLAQKQYEEGGNGKLGWEGCFNDMALKTVIRRLLAKYGYLSIEMQQAVASEIRATEDADAVEIRNQVNTEPKPVFDAAQYAKEADYQDVTDEDANPLD